MENKKIYGFDTVTEIKGEQEGKAAEKKIIGFDAVDSINGEREIRVVVDSIIAPYQEEKNQIILSVSRSILCGIVILCVSKMECSNESILKYINMGYKQLADEMTQVEEEKRRPRQCFAEAYEFLTEKEELANVYWAWLNSLITPLKAI
jgi:hypothetical protein